MDEFFHMADPLVKRNKDNRGRFSSSFILSHLELRAGFALQATFFSRNFKEKVTRSLFNDYMDFSGRSPSKKYKYKLWYDIVIKGWSTK